MCLDFPLPRFRIGQRVFIPATQEGGIIYGFTYYAVGSYDWGHQGWTYHIHFDNSNGEERAFDDDAIEGELIAVEDNTENKTMNSNNTEISAAMVLLNQTIGSLQFNANVKLLEEIIETFASNGVSLGDFLLTVSSAIASKYGETAAHEVIRLLEDAAAAADELQPARSEQSKNG